MGDDSQSGRFGKLALTLSYDGTDFAGSQAQPGVRTVQGELHRVLVAMGVEPVSVFAGRTDRGVHAAAQVVSIDNAWLSWDMDLLLRAMNAHLPDDLSVVAIRATSQTFHARYDAIWRAYRYRLASGPRYPAERRTVWFRKGLALDVDAIRQAASSIVGERDMASFAGGGEGVPWSERATRPKGTVRRVIQCDCRTIQPWWTHDDGQQVLEIRIAANGFLPRMVRNIVGSLVEVGRGAQDVAWFADMMDQRDRRAATGTAPAHGLTLWRVGYPGDAEPT